MPEQIASAEEVKAYAAYLTRMSEEFGALSSLLKDHGLDLASAQAHGWGAVCASEALVVAKGESELRMRPSLSRKKEISEELSRLTKIDKEEAKRGLKDWRKNSR